MGVIYLRIATKISLMNSDPKICVKKEIWNYTCFAADRYLAKIEPFYFIYSLLLKILGPSGASSIYLKLDGDLLTSKWNLQRGLLGGSVHYKQNRIKNTASFLRARDNCTTSIYVHVLFGIDFAHSAIESCITQS